MTTASTAHLNFITIVEFAGKGAPSAILCVTDEKGKIAIRFHLHRHWHDSS